MSRRMVSLRKYTRSSYVYTSGRSPTKKQPTTITKWHQKVKTQKEKQSQRNEKGERLYSQGVVISLHCQLKWIWNYLTPVYDRPSREVYSVGKIHSENDLSHPKIWILGWKKEKGKREHQHSPPLCFLTLDTMWPAVSYSYHDSNSDFCFSQSFSALLDSTFKSWIPINPFSVSSFS